MKRIIQLYDQMWEKGFRYCFDFQDTLVLLQFLSDEGKFGNVFQTMNPAIKQQRKKNVAECLRRPFSGKKVISCREKHKNGCILVLVFESATPLYVYISCTFFSLRFISFFINTSFSAGAKGAAIIAHLYMGHVETAEEIRR